MTVSIGRVHSAGGAASYFAADNYYTAEEAEGSSIWEGEGARQAELSGQVDSAVFENILNGILPDGTQIGDADKRDHGRDFTFSMPKSLSLLALVTGDTRILDAHMEAVKETMKWAEKNLAEARVKVDGKDVAVRTGNLVYALFQHDTSRKTDPQSHIHAVTANLTRLPERYRKEDYVDPKTGEVTKDEGWRAWHNGKMYEESATLTSIHNAELRARVEKLRYKTELVSNGKHGAFEALGPNGERINAEALEGFSKRSQDIKAKAADLGIQSAAGRREVTARTRDAKIDPGDRSELKAKWREEAHELGYNGDAIYIAALQAARDAARPERGLAAVRQVIVDAAKRFTEYLKGPSDPLVDKDMATRLRLAPEARAQYATASAIRILEEREAAFKSSDVVKTALDLGMKGVTQKLVEARLDALKGKGDLVAERSSRFDGAVDFVTTRESIEQERRILASMEKGSGEGRAPMPADEAAHKLQELAGDKALNPEQLAAAIQIISSPDRTILVQGRAGSGKSTMLQPVAKAESIDHTARLLGAEGTKAMLLTAEIKGNAKALAFQNKMVADLRESTGLEAMTVHSFIMRNERFLDKDVDPKAFDARKAELSGSYLILDEASMISNDQMDKLTRIANVMEVGRLAVIGDRKQLNPIGAGKAFSVMQAARIQDGLDVAAVNTNMRQQNDEMRLVADLADRGEVRLAFEAMGSRVITSKDRVEAAAKAWLALGSQERDKTSLLPAGKEDRARANDIIQQGLKDEGTLTGEGRNFNVRETVSLTHEELRYSQNWRQAEFLEIGSTKNSLNLAKGDYRIEKIYENGRVQISDMKGNKAKIDPSKIAIGRKNEAISLANETSVKIHEGEKIRWTDNDKRRDMLRSNIAVVEKVSPDGIVVRLQNGEERILGNGDPMLKRMDLAYAINTHMAQGITNETVYSVMGARQTNLSNARSFLVNNTRQQNDLKLFTDDKAKLIAQIERNRGDKQSAVEIIGELAVEKLLRDAQGDKPVTDKDRGTSHDPKDAPAQSLAEKLDLPALDNSERAKSQPHTDQTQSNAKEISDRLDIGALVEAKAPEDKPQQVAKPTETKTTEPKQPEPQLQIDRSKGLEL